MDIDLLKNDRRKKNFGRARREFVVNRRGYDSRYRSTRSESDHDDESRKNQDDNENNANMRSSPGFHNRRGWLYAFLGKTPTAFCPIVIGSVGRRHRRRRS